MSLQKAIEILEEYEKLGHVHPMRHGTGLVNGYNVAIELLKANIRGSTRQPSPDTQYKKDLTAWIERKQKERNTFDSSQEQIREYFKKVLNKKPSPEIEQAMKELKRERIDPLIVRDNGLSRWNVTCLDHEEGEG